ncbi:MAG: serine hydrolase [candidate division Zixibacteria bacterium]|nr:serine hydrolase [candidate division Zixibacteria bacterium]
MMRRLNSAARVICLILAVLVSLPAVQVGSSSTKAPASKVKNIPLRSRAAAVVDLENRVILYSKNPTAKRSIASITKLMTVLVFLEQTSDLGIPIIVLNEDRTVGSSHFRVGNSYRLVDLLHGVLMSSDNRAAKTLVRSTGFSTEEFVQMMNEKTLSLGLRDTRFADPTGLKVDNLSTVLDCVKLISIAMQDSLISSISTKRDYTCRSVLKKYRVQLRNTNQLLTNENLQVLVGKTGFIRNAGYCLATCVGDGNGKKVAIVVLGAPSNTTRFQEMYKLIRWTSQSYNINIS